ncbi:MAG: cation transporter [Bacteroidales bacterium]|nr:cation transporter [Bacteroidales bacterium]MBN2819717.1 cation transporter [Bacteroidales bacterium]
MDKKKAGYLEGLISIVVNTGLFILKLWAGIVSGSIALTADAWHTLSDSFSSIIVIIGVKLSSKKPDREHPFGHGRWEQIAAIFIGFLLGIIAYDFFKNSIIEFKNEESANFGALAIIATIASIVIKEGLAQYAFSIGRKTGNLSVKADGWHHRTDALSSVVVLIGIFFTNRFWWIDSVLGIIIALMLFYAAFEIIKDAITKLLGEKPSEELIERVKQIVRISSDSDIAPHHFHIHNYISSQELTFHIKVDNNSPVSAAHELATKIESRIFEELNINATIHIEPKGVTHVND